MTIRILIGDCRDVLKTLPDASVDSIVTDPPYGLEFMGVAWDTFSDREKGRARPRNEWGDFGSREHARHQSEAARIQRKKGLAFQEFSEAWAREALRVLKPGGHLLAFSGTRTYHRMVCAIEDAGFEIRDQIGWAYGSGFPKSLDVSKAIDKAAGAERAFTPVGKAIKRMIPGADQNATGSWVKDNGREYQPGASEPATEAARQWQGWGTALKPAWEPICVARKPLIGNVAANVLTHGTGALNIDGCRIPTADKLGGGNNSANVDRSQKHEGWKRPWMTDAEAAALSAERSRASTARSEALGRWPANLIHDGSEEVLQAFPDAPGQQADESRTAPSSKTSNVYGRMNRVGEPSADSDNEGVVGFKMKPGARRLDSGSAARFFYCAKADKADRGEGNTHPTVKPADLMRYLCRLVTPRGGTVLDPFAGSGSTLLAADREGFDAIGIEMNQEYAEMARRRIYGDAPLFAEVDGA